MTLRRRCDAVIVGEDCGGLCTFGKAAKQLEVTGHVVRVDKAFVSESDPDLQQLLANGGYAIVTSVIFDDNNGNLQPVHVHGLGWPCQPESRMGSKMRGKDPRAKPLSSALSCILFSKPLVVLLENVEGFYAYKAFNPQWKICHRLWLFDLGHCHKRAASF